MSPEHMNELEGVPPSAKLVVKVLEHNDAMTQLELIEETRLPQRAVRDALQTLEANGVVSSRVFFHDLRQRLYELTIDLSRPE